MNTTHTLILALAFASQAMGQALDPQIVWKPSLQLPLTDSAGKTLGGTEIIEIAAHRGKLYAGNSYWGDSWFKPAQVFVLDGPSHPWRLDWEAPDGVNRCTSLAAVTFHTDANGQAIGPRPLLLLGVNCRRTEGQPTPVVVFVRDDARNGWVQNVLAYEEPLTPATTVRSIGFHRDRVTGADMVFLGTASEGPADDLAISGSAGRFSHLGIYSGVFDAGQPGGIRWGKAPELSPGVNQRFMGFAVCNGSLYAATQKRLYQRVSDGPSPQWKLLHDFRDDSAIRAAYGDKLDPGWVYYDHMRAICTVPNPSGAGEALIFGALNRIFRLDPTTDRIEPEVDIRELFWRQLGMDVYYVQTQHADRIRRPDGRESLFIGLELMFENTFVEKHPEVPVSSVPDQPWSRRGAGTVHWAKQGFYLERWCQNGAVKYAIREIHDTTRTEPDWLARVRSVCESPFTEAKGKAVYAAGFGAWGLRVSNTGWIYRGEFKASTSKASKLPKS